jgi:hypothetical protein
VFSYSQPLLSYFRGNFRAPGSAKLALVPSVCAIAIACLWTSTAHAALISTGACNDSALSQPFTQWGDKNNYELVTGGNFEGSLAGWTLTGAAKTVSGSEPYGVTGEVGDRSLNVPAGSSAESPFSCVDASYPSFRFFAKDSNLLSTMAVQVVYKTALGEVALPLGAVALSTKWSPTLPMLTGSVVGGLLSGGTAQVALRFTALTGSTQIDDIFIDPRMN